MCPNDTFEIKIVDAIYLQSAFTKLNINTDMWSLSFFRCLIFYTGAGLKYTFVLVSFAETNSIAKQ